MARRVYLHIGAPKSGTTYLQTVLWTHREVLRDHGVLIPGNAPFDLNRTAVAMRTARIGPKIGEVWEQMGEDVRRWNGTAILSCEWFCLTPETLVERAVEHFGGNVDVVYTARELAGLVPAAWQESLKLGTGQPLDDFVAALDEDGERWTWWALDPAEVLARWSPPIPPRRVHIVTVPPPGSRRALLWERFAELVRIRDVEIDLKVGDVNPSLGVESAALMQRLGPSLRSSIDAVNLPWQQTYRWLRRYFAHDVLRDSEGGRIALSPNDAASVAARAASGVAQMRTAGYDVVGDLNDLLRTVEGTHPSDVSAESQLEIATEVISRLLADVRQRTLRAERLARGPDAAGPSSDEESSESEDTDESTAHTEAANTATVVARPVDAGPKRSSLDRSDERVYFLVANLDGRGGVARSVIEQANRLAKERTVEIISVLRKHDAPLYAVAQGVRIRYLVDNRHIAGALVRPKERNVTMGSLTELDEQPSRFSVTETTMSGLTDARLAEVLPTLEPGVLISVRPSLHRAATELAPSHMVLIGQEHLNLQTRRQDDTWPRVRESVEGLDVLVTLTESDREDWSRELCESSVAVKCIPNPLPWPLTEPAPLAANVVVSGGRLERRKGFIRLVRCYVPVARARPDWELRIYGIGEDRPALEELIEREGVGQQVRLMGYTDDLESEFRQASIFAMASHYEGLPMVLLEAASVGLPLVSMDCPRGPADVIRDGVNGRLVPDGDEASMTQALLDVIDDAGARAKMGTEAFETAQAYHPDRITRKWLDLFDSLLSRRLAN